MSNQSAAKQGGNCLLRINEVLRRVPVSRASLYEGIKLGIYPRPVRIADGGYSLAHADGTPFFWLGDTVWNGLIRSSAGDWDSYDSHTAVATTLIFKEMATPKASYILSRGEYDQHGAEVTRRTPTMLPPMIRLRPATDLLRLGGRRSGGGLGCGSPPGC